MEERDREIDRFVSKVRSSGGQDPPQDIDPPEEANRGPADLNTGGDKLLDELESTMDRRLRELDDRYNREFSRLEKSAEEETQTHPDEVEDQLRECQKAMEVLKTQAQASTEEVRARCLEQIKGLQNKLEAAGQRVQELRASGEGRTQGLHHSLRDIFGAVKSLISRLKEGRQP